MYVKPTKEGIERAMEDGWDRESAERGYDIFDFDQTGLLEIERIDACYVENVNDVTDDDCAIEAERSGFCKIIPVNELPNPFMVHGYNRRFYGYVDTPKNRKIIEEYTRSNKYDI